MNLLGKHLGFIRVRVISPMNLSAGNNVPKAKNNMQKGVHDGILNKSNYLEIFEYPLLEEW